MRTYLRWVAPFAIVGLSLALSAQILATQRPERVLYVPVPAGINTAADATQPAQRQPMRLAGYGDSSMEWGLGAAFITLDSYDPSFEWDSNPDVSDRNTHAELGCPLVDDGLLFTFAGQDSWSSVGNEVHPCAWPPVPDVGLVIASFGPTSMWDRKPPDGGRVSILDPAYRAQVSAQMDVFEAHVGVPVLWMSWLDDPSPAQYEQVWLELVSARGCWFDLGALGLGVSDYEPDLIHLSAQGSLTVASALVVSARSCLNT